jgi:glycosyltransferase involved in cell wall biosynthesis
MKISIICTVRNEEKSIKFFLDSIIHQTKKPNEFIVVDGGSEDKTYSILKKYSKKYKWVKIFKLKGANIAKGRNYAIKKSKNEIIIGADAGTKYKKDWLDELIRGFNGEVGFGQTLPLIKSNFQKILSKKLKQRFGSSRNIIFNKKIWRKVGRYPEDLDMAEDTVFNERIKKAGFKIKFIPKAIGYWTMRNSLEEVKKQFYNYGYWDGVAYKKYKILPIKYKIAVIGLSALSVFYPIFLLLSEGSLSIKIDVVRRSAYIKGFWRGFFKKVK